MATATIVFRLCGSGKTWLAKQISASTGAERFDGPYGNNLWPAIAASLPRGRHGIAPSYQSVCSDVRPRKCDLALCQNCVTYPPETPGKHRELRGSVPSLVEIT